jgi:ribosomal-protein-alanine N-acetyltransferase
MKSDQEPSGDIRMDEDHGGSETQKSKLTDLQSAQETSESRIDVRWLIRRDMDEVLRIENESFGVNRWSEAEFLACLKQRNCIGVTIVRDYSEVLGFMIYQLSKQKLIILNIAVQPESRRQGYGRLAIQRLKDKLHQQRRTSVQAHVTEDNLNAHLFFSECGFRCEKTERGDNGRDRLVFAYRITEEVSKEGSAV